MGFFNKIADKMSGKEREVKFINDLCEHLRQIGVNATVLNRESPEVNELLAEGGGIGYIMIADRNLDLIKVGKRSREVETGGPEGGSVTHSEYYGVYLKWGTIGPSHIAEERKTKDISEERKLKVFKLLKRFDLIADPGPSTSLVTGTATRKGFIRKQVVDFQWEDGYLAQLLNADSDLKNMLMKARLHNISVDFHDWRVGQFVDIHPEPDKLERKTFPNRETFELYDRIAQHVRSIMKTENTSGEGV